MPSPATMLKASHGALALDANAVIVTCMVPKFPDDVGSKDWVPGSKPDVFMKLFNGSLTKANTAHTTKINATENDAPRLVSNVRSACVSSNTCLSANKSMFLNAAGHFRWTKMMTRPPMAHAMYTTMLVETAVALVLEPSALLLANVEKGEVGSLSLFSSWSLGLFASSVVVGVLD